MYNYNWLLNKTSATNTNSSRKVRKFFYIFFVFSKKILGCPCSCNLLSLFALDIIVFSFYLYIRTCGRKICTKCLPLRKLFYMIQQRLFSLADSLVDTVREQRRDIHKLPELSYSEYRTSELVRHFLSSHDIDYVTVNGCTAVVAVIKGMLPGSRCVALRADMDALPIKETASHTYCSVNEGVMHACGHDAHTAMLLGVAAIINEMRDCFGGTVKLIFQHAEEKLPGGATEVVSSHLVDDVDVFVAQHVYPDLPCGKVGFCEGPYMASCDEVNIDITGRGGHAARPWERDNAVAAAVSLLNALYYRFPEPAAVDATSCLLAFGSVYAGCSYNVIPDKVTALGTLRTFSPSLRHDAKETIKSLAHDVTSDYGCEANVHISHGYPSLVNDVNLTRRCAAVARSIVGGDNVVSLFRLMTAEDFAVYSQLKPSCFFRLGTSNPEKGVTGRQHTAGFDIDEDALAIGTRLMALIALDIMNG